MKIPEKIQMYKLDAGWNDIGSWDNFIKIYKSKKIYLTLLVLTVIIIIYTQLQKYSHN